MSEGTPIICYGKDGPAFERVCPKCRRFIAFPKEIEWREKINGHCEFPDVECRHCGPVQAEHIGWAGDFPLMTAQVERALQTECMLRLRALPVLAFPIPNSIYFPARTEAERSIIARVVSQMKAVGMLVPGAPDLAVFWRRGGGLIELKRPSARDLFGRRHTRGRLTGEQAAIEASAGALGINHAVCASWAEVRGALTEWGAL